MKKTLTTLLALGTVGLMSAGLISCRKDKNEPDIKTYDQQQIENYIKANNLTGMQRDLTSGDTTGIYYQILRPGTGKVLDYSDVVNFVYTERSFDGQYVATDTIAQHGNVYLGELTPPKGLMLAVKNLLIHDGTQAHILIPSHLAYGTNGFSSPKINGNQCIDYYINIIQPTYQATYDDMVIQNYIKANNLTGYTRSSTGLYYKVTQAGTGTTQVTDNSVIGIQFTSKMLDGVIFDEFNAADTTAYSLEYAAAPKGWQEGFKHVTKGAKLSLIMPSTLGYGTGIYSPGTVTNSAGTGLTLPASSCVYTDFNIMSVSN